MTRQYDAAVERIDRTMSRRHEEGLGPGLSFALTTNERLLATQTYGVKNADTREPVTDETLFQIGSITKHFTAIACLRLSEQGRLDLHSPITDSLDWFKVPSQFETPVTIHHLLTHTSGLPMMLDAYPSSWWQAWALRDTELGFEPGARFSYSNVGYNVLQCVIQAVTGSRFDDALRELVFEPLGMENSYGEVMNCLYDRMAKGHKYSTYDDRPVPRPKEQAVVNWYEMSAGCGSVVMTSSDLARFLRMLLNHGRAEDGSLFLSEAAFGQLIHPHATMEGFFDGMSQGYGVLIERSEATGDRPRIIGGGENLGFEATMYGDFDAGVGVVLFCNSFDIPWSETRWMLETLIAASRDEPLPDTPEMSPFRPQPIGETAVEYVGDFASIDRTFSVGEADGALTLSANGTIAPLERIWGDSFLTGHPNFDRAMLTFGRDESGRVVEGFQLGDWFRSDRYDGPTAFEYPAAWDGFVGQYRAFGILVTNVRIFVRKGQLYIQSFGGYVDQPLVDLGDGRFRRGGETSPEQVTFDCLAGGKTLRCRISGADYYRME